MADKEPGDEGLLPDVVDNGSALALSHEDATALALKMAGEPPPDECRFHCIMCGWNKTLKFEEDEILALGGDITNYGGPCGGCSSMTLVPHNKLVGIDGSSILEQARANKMEDYQDAADVFVDRVKKEVATVMGGGAPGASASAKDPRDDLPDAADVDADAMEPKKV